MEKFGSSDNRLFSSRERPKKMVLGLVGEQAEEDFNDEESRIPYKNDNDFFEKSVMSI